jgi:hypothetical protein
VLTAVKTRQQKEAERLGHTTQAIYANRDGAWWARRYAEAADGSGPPLRVVIPTTRYSTYIQHASRDLAEALHESGCEVELVIEPDDHTKLSSITYLSAVERVKPDLVILINYTRANAGGMFPPQLPFVCWVQDAMWQQFDPEVGAGQTDMDFMAGHLFPELFERFDYPRRNTLSMPIVVSRRKFHDGPIDPVLLAEHTCEIAYVGHQSETPQSQRDRVLGEVAGDPLIRQCLELMSPGINEIATDPVNKSAEQRLVKLAAETIESVTGEPDEALAARMLRLWVLPMADRILRHESLEWAAEVARGRGWRMRIYGRGWDEHPTLGPFACGELAHGEALRASYRAAAVHLHLTINTIRHQRVMECVLSGGLPLCRRKIDDLTSMRDEAINRVVRERQPVVAHLPSRYLGYAVADHPRLMAYAALVQRYGVDTSEYRFQYLNPAEIDRRLSDAHRPVDRDDAWLFGDPAEITFASPQDLEQRVERARQRPAWRENLSKAIARRVRDRYTSKRFAQCVIEMVRESFQDNRSAERRAG